jgi:hypothetical protein
MPSAIAPARGCCKGSVMTIQETDVVTLLRPAKAKRADNTAALRQRRSRAKRKPSVMTPAAKPLQISGSEQINEIKADVTVAQRAARTNYALVAIA